MFHIDHFRPYSKFKHLECDYENLVYACSYCNIAKSDDWPSNVENPTVKDGEGYIDPCSSEFDFHLERDGNGAIRPLTNIGDYMHRKLKLGLKRHELAWKYEILENLLKRVVIALEEEEKGTLKYDQLVENFIQLHKEFFLYKKRFEETL